LQIRRSLAGCWECPNSASPATLVRDIAVPVNAPIDQLDNIPLSDVQGFKEVALPWYTDQVLPIDITLAAANEYGAAASAKLFGVEILNEGFGTSIDDSVMEQQATFVARSVSPLQAVGRTSLLVAIPLAGSESVKYRGFSSCEAPCDHPEPLPISTNQKHAIG